MSDTTPERVTFGAKTAEAAGAGVVGETDDDGADGVGEAAIGERTASLQPVNPHETTRTIRRVRKHFATGSSCLRSGKPRRKLQVLPVGGLFSFQAQIDPAARWTESFRAGGTPNTTIPQIEASGMLERLSLRGMMDRPIPDSYWVVDGLLLAGEYAGASTAARARHKLEALLDAGIRTFFDLTEEGELSPYDDMLRELARDRAIAVSHERMPIRDLGVPDPSDLYALLARIAINIAEGTPSYVHCWGGVGRTGTVIGCWLVEHQAMDGNDALTRIEELRRDLPDSGRRSPETDEQCALVRGWAEISRSKAVQLPGGDGC